MTCMVATMTNDSEQKVKGAGSYDDHEVLYPEDVASNRRTTQERIAVSAYVGERIEESKRGGDTYDAIAARFKFSKASAINVALHGKIVGLDIQQKVANVLFKGSLDALKRAALEWWNSDQGAEYRRVKQLDDVLDVDATYPNRSTAIHCGRLLGFDERSFDKLRTIVLKGAVDPPPRWWFKQLDAIEDELSDPYRSELEPLVGDPIDKARKPPRKR